MVGAIRTLFTLLAQGLRRGGYNNDGGYNGEGIGSDVGEGLSLDQMSRKYWLIRVLPEQQSWRKAPPT